MNKKTLIILGVGLLVSIGLSVFMMQSLSKKPAPQVVEKVVPKKVVLAAAGDINAGDRISNENTKWIEIPETDVEPSMIVRSGNETVYDITKNAKLSTKILADQPVLRSAFLTNADIMSASLDDGKRAVAIEVSASSLAGGFITPGDHVDVIVTFAVRTRTGDDERISHMVNRFASQVVLRHVKVLAIDQNPERPEKGARVGRTATLEVDDLGARKLMLASNMGGLSLVLRALGDESVETQEHLVTDVTVGKIYREIARTQSETGNSGNYVRVLTSGGVQNVLLRSQAGYVPPAAYQQDYPNN